MISKNKVLEILFYIALGVVLLSLIVLIGEILDAKNGCEELKGNYSLRLEEGSYHYCDDAPIYRYTDGRWGYHYGNISSYLIENKGF